MALVERGKTGLDRPVGSVLPDFAGMRPVEPSEDPLSPGARVSVDARGASAAAVDAGSVTFHHLLAHTSGLPAWRPLFRQGSPEAARADGAHDLLLIPYRHAHGL